MSAMILKFPEVKKPVLEHASAGSVYATARRLKLVNVAVAGMDADGNFYMVHNGMGDDLIEMASEWDEDWV
jgi:hypothetical protein